MMKILKVRILVSLFIYLSISFVKFNILWFLEIPKYSNSDRCFMMIVFILIQLSISLLKEEIEKL